MENTQDNLTEKLPPIRVAPDMLKDLQGIADRSVSNKISAHVREALRIYINLYKKQVHNN